MLKDIVDFNVDIFKGYLNENEISFLQQIDSKQNEIHEKIKQLKNKKEEITKKIVKDKKNIRKNTKEYREYIENMEATLESIDLVFKNFEKLNINYRNIEESFAMLSEQSKANFAWDELKQKIKEAETLEQHIKEDNEKNYIIIDNYIEKTANANIEVEENTEFYKLNLDNLQDNLVLKICEKRVELPYTKKEIEDFLSTYPDEYKTVQDVIAKEFMVHIELFKKHPILARFKEAYYLCRTKEMMTIIESFSYAKSIMFKSEINPYIIAAVKSKKQLEDYIKYLEEGKLQEYPHFKIIFEINPLIV